MTPHVPINTTQEFRDEVLASLAEMRAEARERHAATSGWLEKLDARIATGAACVAGARHAERLDGHDREIDRLRKPTRKAVALVGAGGISVVALIELARQVWGALTK